MRQDTARLRLRKFTLDDLDELARMRGDAAVAKFLGDGTPHTRAMVEQRLRFYLKCYATHGYGMCATLLQATGEFIGWSGLQPRREIDATEIGYGFDQPFWGQGFATEVAAAWLEYGFNELKLKRIVAVALPENRASRRVMEKLGMRYEGNVIASTYECACYALTRAEFLAAHSARTKNGTPAGG